LKDVVTSSPVGCPPAEPGTNWDRSEEREPVVLTGRRGGTDEIRGRGVQLRSRGAGNSVTADPSIAVWCRLWADAVSRMSPMQPKAKRSTAVRKMLARKEKNLPTSAVRLLTNEAI